jgi:hypothetical protein
MVNIVSDPPLRIGSSQWRRSVFIEHLRITSATERIGSSLGKLGHTGVVDIDMCQENFAKTRLLACDELARHLTHSASNDLKNAFSFQLSTEGYDSLVAAIKASGLLGEVVQALGSEDIIFHSPCGLYARTVDPSHLTKMSEIDGSGFWHRDSIGNAIKIFVCLDCTGNGINTELITGTHAMDPFVRNWEMIRSHDRLDLINTFDDTVYMDYQSNISSISLKPGQCFAFNTNAAHRGIYLTDQDGSRLTYQITVTTVANAKLFDLFHQTNNFANSRLISALT